MNTVSTLCATTTVGAAAIGYAFGLPNSQAKADRTKPSLTPSQFRHATGTSQLSVKRQRPPASNSSTHANATSSTPERSEVSGPQAAILDTRTDSGAASGCQRYQTESAKLVQAPCEGSLVRSDDRFELPLPRRRSRPASWAVSRSSSPQSSLRPGSLVPLISQDTPIVPQAPNKLVKRSLSPQNRSSSGTSYTGRNSRRGPATSHQRSATFPLQSFSEEVGANDGNTESPSPMGASHKPFRHYFRSFASSVGSNASAWTKKQSMGDAGSIRRIQPQGFQKPVLVLADCVASIPVDSVRLGQIPSTTSATYKLSSQSTGTDQILISPPEPARSHNVDLNDRRRSFSISDLLSGNFSLRRGSEEVTSRSRRKLHRPLSQRIISAPVTTEILNRIDGTSNEGGMGKWQGRACSYGGLDPLLKGRGVENIDSLDDRVDRVRQATASTKPSEHTFPPQHMQQSPSYSGEFPSPHPSTPSTGLTRSISRPSRHSATPSELNSSQLGSDADANFFSDADEGDLRSDTVYDSMRTANTRDSPVFPGSLFDKDPASEKDVNQSTFLHSAQYANSPTIARKHNEVIVEEDESVSTPIRTVKGANSEQRPRRSSFRATTPLGTSPPSMPRPLKTGTLEWDSTVEDEFAWLCDEEEESFSVKPNGSHQVTQDLNTHLQARPPNALPLESEHETRYTLFDWFEQAAVEKTPIDIPIRPKTVHGKKDTESRSGRSAGRRAPSGPHARSQSVPVLTEQSGTRTGVASKFGTWGIGSKGATEDWDDDFDFSGPRPGDSQIQEEGHEIEQSDSPIFVPQIIREQQTSVLANIGLLKEWGLHIEELKELRTQAANLILERSSFLATFDEVDAMIDLADQEAQEEVGSHRSSTSPSFEVDENAEHSASNWTPSRRPSEYDVEVSGPSTLPAAMPAPNGDIPGTPSKVTGRPRKNSEAIARSVIQAIQHRRSPLESLSEHPRPLPTSKVPFDKGTLRHILPHLGNLVKAMKNILHDAEGLSNGNSPIRQSDLLAPPFSQAFVAPPTDSPSPSKGQRNRLRLYSVDFDEGENVAAFIE